MVFQAGRQERPKRRGIGTYREGSHDPVLSISPRAFSAGMEATQCHTSRTVCLQWGGVIFQTSLCSAVVVLPGTTYKCVPKLCGGSHMAHFIWSWLLKGSSTHTHIHRILGNKCWSRKWILWRTHPPAGSILVFPVYVWYLFSLSVPS